MPRVAVTNASALLPGGAFSGLSVLEVGPVAGSLLRESLGGRAGGLLDAADLDGLRRLCTGSPFDYDLARMLSVVEAEGRVWVTLA